MNFSRDGIHRNIFFWLDLFTAEEGKVFYDIGAHRGEFVCHYAPRCSAVVAFEPDPDNLMQLDRECAVFSHCHIMDIALSSEKATQILYQYSDSSFNSLYSRNVHNLSHYQLEFKGVHEVRTDALDAVMESESLPDPRLMKIDVEGAELPVLEGARRVLKDSQPLLVVEQSKENTENAGYDRQQIRDFLVDVGYQVYGLFRSSDTHLYDGDRLKDPSIWNLIAAARDEDLALLKNPARQDQ